MLLAFVGLGTLGLVGLVAFWAGAESDTAALDRQKELVSARLHEQVNRVAKDLSQIATGHLAVFSNAMRPQADIAMALEDRRAGDGYGGEIPSVIDAPVAEAIAQVAQAVFGYDRAYVVDGNGDLLTSGETQSAQRYKWTKPLLQPLLDQWKTPAGGAKPTPDPLSGGPEPPDRSRRKGGGATTRTVVDLMRLEGHPVVVGVIPLEESARRPELGSPVPSLQARYFIVIRFLDGALLDDISHEHGLTGARFARSADIDDGEIAFQIDDTTNGSPIGFIVWEPDLPGSRVIARLVPALSIAALIIATLLGALLWRLRRTLDELGTSERQARHLAYHDVLTGLPNRALLAQRLDTALVAGALKGTRTAVALIDLDRFKAVNDTFGHGAGDELIREVARRLSALLRPGDTLARLGGDEFAVVVRDIGPGPDVVHAIGVRIVAEIAKPFRLGDGSASAQVGCSIGVAIAPDAGAKRDDLVRKADVALYTAKAGGRGRLAVFAPFMDEGRQECEALKGELRQLLAASREPPLAGQPLPGRLEIYFQTIHGTQTGNPLCGAEALVRWHHPSRGLLTAGDFVPLAEESGLITALGTWVLHEACAAAARWPGTAYVAVNVSPSQLREADFADEVLNALRLTGLDPRRLELELTEGALLDSDPGTTAALSRLRREGVRIALDDFGTGYSSLSHLRHFEIDRIKVDRSFVALIGTGGNGAAIVQAVISLGRNLGIATTAEGVETEAQVIFLSSFGCSDLQGYHFSKPMPGVELACLLDGSAARAAEAAGSVIAA